MHFSRAGHNRGFQLLEWRIGRVTTPVIFQTIYPSFNLLRRREECTIDYRRHRLPPHYRML